MTALFLLGALTLASPAHAPGHAAGTHPFAPTPASQIQDTLARTVHGRVVSERSGEPLPFALVELGEGSTRRRSVTDEQGRYQLDHVPAGRQRIRVVTMDHAPLEITVQVPETGHLQLDLSLRLSPIELAGITVVSRRVHDTPVGGAADGTGRGTPADPELRALEASPGMAELGLADGARTEPHVDPDPESALYVRGAASDLKLVLLDGAPVYAPFHLGGLMPAFAPGVLESAWLYAGGAPARYDGGLSYILDLQTRAGRQDTFHTHGAIDLLGAGTRVEGPLAAGSYLAAARAVHRMGTDGYTPDPLPYEYVDVLARVDQTVGASHHLSATGFFNREAVRLGEASPIDEPAHWGNFAGSLRYDGRVLGGDAHLTAALAEFSTRLPVGVKAPGIANGRSLRTRLTADLLRPIGDTHLAYGLAYDRQQIDYRARAVSDSGVTWLARHGDADALGGYGELIWRPAADVQVRSGVRANLFLATEAVRLAPRASLAWQLSETSTLSLAAGRYYQYLRIPETVLSSDLSDTWSEVVAGTDTTGRQRALGIAGASHVSVGLGHRPREELRLGMEGYYKVFDGAREVEGLRASGVDLWIDWRDGPWEAWAGYSLAWAWTGGAVDFLDRRFSARHLLSGGLRAPLPSGVRFDLQLSTSHGLPFTPIPTGTRTQGASFEADEASTESLATARAQESFSGAPDGSYLRLDARLSRSWIVKLLGGEVELVPYLKVLNALDRRDALFYQFDATRDLRPRSLEAVPLLPIVGVEWHR